MRTQHRSRYWIALGIAAIVAVSLLTVFLTAPRPGGRMDPNATAPQGAHALVTLLRERGVDVTVADTLTDVERSARADSLLLVAETRRIGGDELDRLAGVPGDLLLVAPDARARQTLAPAVRDRGPRLFADDPDCDLREARLAGPTDLQAASTYVAAGAESLRSCYDGALVRYRDGARTVTVVGSTSFMTNADLAHAGNTALALNLAGARSHLVWFAPQHLTAGATGTATLFDLIPKNISWLFWQLCLALACAALWQGRRLGPLVAESLPVVVRASETVEGLGRLYRAHRAADRAGAALRAAALRRITPRLGLGPAADPSAVAAAVGRRVGAHPDWVRHVLFGSEPQSDTDLVRLARVLDDIERKVTHS
ncbi:DUF4350 domain-containing protein [Mycobacterium sp. M1]|uniref:DUF4350 domain-containing protein n=1 Tax=Mycolicibacter acidiphilus TaxID=2835306 RepID=A0ABS5RPI6_9MYCO|nr:DUF4350 domain-containing protein [Mycolicibacter acidiphilus]MBS9536192.1 DUF4350 domain-containing protein [Mycolicibacter acidiphilus]